MKLILLGVLIGWLANSVHNRRYNSQYLQLMVWQLGEIRKALERGAR